MEISSPRLVRGTPADAVELARREVEPVFVPATVHVDDRGWSMVNLLQGVLSPQGQVNVSLMHPGVIKAWHRHRFQTDFWIVARGHIKAGVHRDDGRAWMIVLGEMNPGVLIIPPDLWHGAATVGAEPASLIYYVTHRYNPDAPDEQRRAFDALPHFPWKVDHR